MPDTPRPIEPAIIIIEYGKPCLTLRTALHGSGRSNKCQGSRSERSLCITHGDIQQASRKLFTIYLFTSVALHVSGATVNVPACRTFSMRSRHSAMIDLWETNAKTLQNHNSR